MATDDAADAVGRRPADGLRYAPMSRLPAATYGMHAAGGRGPSTPSPSRILAESAVGMPTGSTPCNAAPAASILMPEGDWICCVCENNNFCQKPGGGAARRGRRRRRRSTSAARAVGAARPSKRGRGAAQFVAPRRCRRPCRGSPGGNVISERADVRTRLTGGAAAPCPATALRSCVNRAAGARSASAATRAAVVGDARRSARLDDQRPAPMPSARAFVPAAAPLASAAPPAPAAEDGALAEAVHERGPSGARGEEAGAAGRACRSRAGAARRGESASAPAKIQAASSDDARPLAGRSQLDGEVAHRRERKDPSLLTSPPGPMVSYTSRVHKKEGDGSLSGDTPWRAVASASPAVDGSATRSSALPQAWSTWMTRQASRHVAAGARDVP